MMICTVRFSKKKAVAILLAIAIILAAVILAMPERGAGADAAGASGAVRTEEDQAAYLGALRRRGPAGRGPGGARWGLRSSCRRQNAKRWASQNSSTTYIRPITRCSRNAASI